MYSLADKQRGSNKHWSYGSRGVYVIHHGYIRKCVHDLYITRIITIHSNQKPCVSAEVNFLLKTCDSAFRSNATRRILITDIKRAKATHVLKIQCNFSTNDPRACVDVSRASKDSFRRDAEYTNDLSLSDYLNTFNAYF